MSAQVVAGALLAVGILTCGVADEVDPALALLSGVPEECLDMRHLVMA